MEQGTAADPEPEGNTRITFRDLQQPSGERIGRDVGGASTSRRRSLSRASSRSSRSRLPVGSPYSGVQIEYRTLSIHVSESRREDVDGPGDLKKAKKDTEEYFANLSYHELDKAQICQQLNVSETQGLSADAAASRLQRDGPNVLPQRKANYLKKLFFYVFGGFCSVLWVGVIVFFLCWQPLSSPPSMTNLALAILVIIVIVLQAVFNAFQDWSAQRTMKSIVDLLPSESRVLREGHIISIRSSELVVGDIVHLAMGSKVPADLRILDHSGDIRFDRSMLTGESEEIEGSVNATDQNFLESRNIALQGTMVVNGNGTGVVVLTGNRSVMGRIAQAMGDVKEVPTLIQREISRFVKIIVCLTVVLALLIALSWAGWLRKDHPGFLSVVAMLNNVSTLDSVQGGQETWKWLLLTLFLTRSWAVSWLSFPKVCPSACL
jgi:sodium/potassium-transporting ATPase subunit alpha